MKRARSSALRYAWWASVERWFAILYVAAVPTYCRLRLTTPRLSDRLHSRGIPPTIPINQLRHFHARTTLALVGIGDCWRAAAGVPRIDGAIRANSRIGHRICAVGECGTFFRHS